MRALITTILEVAGTCLVGVAAGFQWGLWAGLIVLGVALIGFGAAEA